jgi:hypothetical protein
MHLLGERSHRHTAVARKLSEYPPIDIVEGASRRIAGSPGVMYVALRRFASHLRTVEQFVATFRSN